MDAKELAVLSTRVKAITKPEPALLWYYGLGALLSMCAFPIVIIPLYFRYHTLWYRFGDEGVSMGYGVLFRREMQLTYARMQDIHLSQNIVERWLGIGTVTVQTAGSGSGGNLVIAGVKSYEAIRDFLYSRMRGVHSGHEGQAPTGQDALLVEIRDALNATAMALALKKEGVK